MKKIIFVFVFLALDLGARNFAGEHIEEKIEAYVENYVFENEGKILTKGILNNIWGPLFEIKHQREEFFGQCRVVNYKIVVTGTRNNRRIRIDSIESPGLC